MPITEVTIARPVDFNADGIDDLLWRGADNSIASWISGGAKVTIGSVAPSTQIEGTGDFNGDGRGDILFQHRRPPGRHLADERQPDRGHRPTSARPPTGWHIRGTGDFNGNGADDILWRNDNGQVATWQIDQRAARRRSRSSARRRRVAHRAARRLQRRRPRRHPVAQRQRPGRRLADERQRPARHDRAVGSAPASWHIAATGDFNGDGRDDILWRNDNGQVAAWLMNGGQISSIATVGSAPASWHIAGTGDLNGNGTDDIILQNDNGQIAGWLMNGGTLAAIQDLGTTPPTTHIVGSHFDFV